MDSLQHLKQIFDDSVKDAKERLKKKTFEKDTRTMRASSINNALKNIQKEIEGQ